MYKVLRGTPVPLKHLHDGNTHLPWQVFADLVSNASRFFDEVDLRETGRRSWRFQPLLSHGNVGRIMFKTRDQYLASYGPSGFFSRHFPMDTSIRQAAGRRLAISITMKDGAQPCHPFYTVLAGQMEGLTEALGLVPASVALKPVARGGFYIVDYPEEGNTALVVRQVMAWMAAPRLINREFAVLQRAHEELASDYKMALEEKRTAAIHHGEQASSHHLVSAHTDNVAWRAAREGKITYASPSGERQPGYGEEELEQKTADYRAITDSAPDAIVTFDAANKITYANPASGNVFGYRGVSLLGMNIKELMPATLGGTRLEEMYLADRFISAARIVLQGVRKDRSLVPLEATFTGHELNGEQFKTCIAHDVTHRTLAERKQQELEAQLYAVQKIDSIGQLSSGIAHDFNNLLAAIIGYADLVLQAGFSVETTGHLEEIKKAGERGADMTRKLLTFSGQQAMEPGLIDANELIEGVRDIISRLLPKNIEVSFTSEVEDVFLMADRTQLEQVLINLAVNARDAMSTGGKFEMSLAITRPEGRQGDYLLLEARDTGTGMDEETLTRIFEPFYTTKPAGQGTGLGLAIVFGIVNQHKGFVRVESELGTGTGFLVYLPTSEGRALFETENETETEAAEVQGGSETILMVEDNEDVRHLANLILTRAGYKVIEAVDGQEGVDIFLARPEDIDLILMDIVMPVMGGETAADIMRSRGARIVFTTGYADRDAHTRFIHERSLALITKPYSVDLLLTGVRTALDGRTSEQGEYKEANRLNTRR